MTMKWAWAHGAPTGPWIVVNRQITPRRCLSPACLTWPNDDAPCRWLSRTSSEYGAQWPFITGEWVRWRWQFRHRLAFVWNRSSLLQLYETFSEARYGRGHRLAASIGADDIGQWQSKEINIRAGLRIIVLKWRNGQFWRHEAYDEMLHDGRRFIWA